MRLTERIMQEMTESLKQKDVFRVQALRLAIAALQNADIEKHGRMAKAGKTPEPLTDEEALEVIAREVKKRSESATEYEKGNRPDLAKNERDEADVLKAYLPAQMEGEALRAAVAKTLEGMTGEEKAQWGKVMQRLSQEFRGKADMGTVSALAREITGMK